MRTLPKATAALIAANVAIFLLQLLWGHGDPAIVLYPMGAMLRDAVTAGEWWRLLSSAFLHVAIWHVAANMYVLYLLGSFLEIILGSSRFLALYAVSALGGGLAVQFFSQGGAGASGAVWGLMTVYLVLAYKPGEALNPEFARRMRRTGWFNVLINLGISFVPGISMSAHLGGGAAGALLALSGVLTRGLAREREFPEDGIPVVHSSAGWRLLAGLSVLVMAGSVAAAILHGRPWELSRPPAHGRVVLPGGRFSIELPTTLAPHLQPPSYAGMVEIEYGDAPATPMLVEVKIGETGATPGGAQKDFDLRAAKAELEKAPLPFEMTRTGTIQIVSIAGHDTLIDEARDANNSRMKRWITVRDEKLIVVSVLFAERIPAAWADEPDRIIGTLQVVSK